MGDWRNICPWVAARAGCVRRKTGAPISGEETERVEPRECKKALFQTEMFLSSKNLCGGFRTFGTILTPLRPGGRWEHPILLQVFTIPLKDRPFLHSRLPSPGESSDGSSGLRG